MIDFAALRTHLLTHERLAPITVRDVVRRLRMLQREGVDLAAISPDQAVAFAADGREAGWTVAQFNNRARALNSWLAFRDGRKDAVLPLLPEQVREYRALSGAQLARMTRALHDMEPLHAAACALALGVGLRPEEARRLDRDDLDAGACTLYVRKPAKRGRQRRIPIPRWVVDHLARFLLSRPQPPAGPDARALLTDDHRGPVRRVHAGSLGRILRDEGKKAGVEVNWQIARHTVATRLLKEGLDIRYVQYYLGHINIRHTARYAEVQFGDVEARFRALPFSGEEEPEG